MLEGLFGKLFKPAQRRLSLEQQLGLLRGAGLPLEPSCTVENLLRHFDRAEYERPGFELLLGMLGCKDDGEEVNYCSCIYDFDTECIEDHDSYESVFMELAQITGGELNISGFEEQVEFSEARSFPARIAFNANGRAYRAEFSQQDDWFNEQALALFVQAFNDCRSSRRLVTRKAFDQNCWLACLDGDQVAALRKLGIRLLDA